MFKVFYFQEEISGGGHTADTQKTKRRESKNIIMENQQFTKKDKEFMEQCIK